MIEITWATAFLLYLTFLLCILFTLWIFSHLAHKRKKLTLSRQEIIICEYCHNTYIADRDRDLSRCPACNSLNKV